MDWEEKVEKLFLNGRFKQPLTNNFWAIEENSIFLNASRKKRMLEV